MKDHIANNMQESFPLQEFVEIFPPPQSGRIAEGFSPDFDAHKAFDIPRGAVLKFHRKVNPNVPLSFQDSWGGAGAENANWITVTLPMEFQGKFNLLPYDPESGDMSIDHIYHTVEELVEAFPVFVQANSSFGKDSGDAKATFECGDRLKLNRLLYKNGAKYLECHLLGDPRLKLLPLDAVGDFTVLPDDNEYLLADLVSMLPRKRRVQVSLDPSNKEHKIPGLPANFNGNLFVEEPESFVEASLPDGTIIGLPHDIDMNVSPEEVTFERGQLLNSFSSNNRNLFPVVARVVDWDEETSILENHFIKPGVELVIHGWTRQSKVLGQSADKCYAIPLTYQGKFKIQPRQFFSVSDLEHVYPGNKLRCTETDSHDFPLAVGDVFRIRRGDSIHKGFKPREIHYLKCEKFEDSGKTKEIKLPIGSMSKFEEVLEGHKAEEFLIREMVSFVTDQDITVTLDKVSPDQKFRDRDLPLHETLTLCDFVVEPAVYVSVETPDAPAFHIPLRTLMYVSFVEQLERSSSPLLTKNSPKLSTLDRCIEIVPADIFAALRPHRSVEVNGDSYSPTTDTAPQHWQATAYHSAYNVPDSQENEDLPPFDRRGSIPESDVVISKTKGGFGAKLKGKFRKHRSQENIHRDSSDSEFASLSLPQRQDVNVNPVYDHNDGVTAIHVNGTRSQNEEVKFGPPNLTIDVTPSSSNTTQYSRQESTAASESVFTDDAARSTTLSTASSPMQSPTSPSDQPQQSPPHPSDITLQTFVPPRHAPSRSTSVQDVSPHSMSPGASLRHAGSVPAMQVTGNMQPQLVPIQVDTGTLGQQQQHMQQPVMMNGTLKGTHQTQNNNTAIMGGGGGPMMLPPGYALVPMGMPTTNQSQVSAIPPGYALVPMMPQMFGGMQQFNPFMQQNATLPHKKKEESSSDDDDDTASNFTLSRAPQFKVVIPPDGNLYNFSAKKMAEFLRQMKLDPAVIKACLKNKVDGKKFSQLMEFDMERLGLIHPVVMHFRRLTYKKKSGSISGSQRDFML